MTVINSGGVMEEAVADAVYATDNEWRQNYCWNSARDNSVPADPERLFSKTNEKSGRTSIILLVMLEDRFRRVGDVKELEPTGLQVTRQGA